MREKLRVWVITNQGSFAFHFLAFTIPFTALQLVGVRDYSLANIVPVVAIACAGGALAAVTAMRAQRKRDEQLGITSTEQRLGLADALRTGELPSSAKVREVLPKYLERLNKLAKQNRKWLPVFAAIGFVAAAYYGFNQHQILAPIILVAFSIEVFFILRQQQRQLANAQKLSSKL